MFSWIQIFFICFKNYYFYFRLTYNQIFFFLNIHYNRVLFNEYTLYFKGQWQVSYMYLYYKCSDSLSANASTLIFVLPFHADVMTPGVAHSRLWNKCKIILLQCTNHVIPADEKHDFNFIHSLLFQSYTLRLHPVRFVLSMYCITHFFIT